MTRTFAYISLLGAVLGGCSKSATSSVGVTVRFSQSSRATCVRVVATSASGFQQMTEPIPRHDRAEVTVGVFPSDQLSGEISLQARGYVGCEEPLLTNEESAAQTVAFGPGVRKVTLVLTGADSSSDADRDGYRAAATGGPDCDDANPEVHPGQTENCTNGIDDDCSQTADCADPSCANASCASGDLCTTGAVCTSERVCVGTLKACNTPPGECHQSQGSCDPSTGNCQYVVNVGGVCSTGICRSDGVCVPPNTEVLCGDGLDNDGDNQTDCLDPDCDAQTCSDGNLCTTGDSCTNSACAPGTPVTCTTPPSACFVSPGACVSANGGCRYTQRDAGVSCPLGECRADAGCGVSEVGMLCRNGFDDDQDTRIDCADPSCQAQPCNDNNACTTGETCANFVCGGGTQVMCMTPPSQCFQATGNCDGGCSYTVRTGLCDGGVCQPDGGCAPSAFPYPPSNFDPNTLAAPSSSLLIDCPNAVFDSTSNTFTTLCPGQATPPAVTVTQTGGPEATLLAVQNLLIGDAGTLKLVGTRPVIFAVYGDATVRGQLLAAADMGTPGAGGSGTFCGLSTGSPGSASSGKNGGGGGGGFGTAGAQGGASASGVAGGSGGTMGGNSTLVPLRGGCSGGGGTGGAAAGGAGGGAVQVSAANTLLVSGVVATPGEGGLGGAKGGGGGGSGGAVLLEGRIVQLGAFSALTANGGGGGEGQGDNNGNNGNDGSSASATPAPGGAGGSSEGGNGGNGGVGSTAPSVGMNGTSDGHGGGGGGAVGRIRINSATICTIDPSAVISPGASSNNRPGCP